MDIDNNGVVELSELETFYEARFKYVESSYDLEYDLDNLDIDDNGIVNLDDKCLEQQDISDDIGLF